MVNFGEFGVCFFEMENSGVIFWFVCVLKNEKMLLLMVIFGLNFGVIIILIFNVEKYFESLIEVFGVFKYLLFWLVKKEG